MSKREGFGAVLADGSRRAAERIGKGSEQYAMHVGGRELPMHDPRFAPAMGLHYIADATPAQHCGSQSLALLDGGTPLGDDPILQSTSTEVFGNYDQKGEHYARGAAYYHLFSALLPV
jgi:aldehyde:ferredoxin oxidoreductase